MYPLSYPTHPSSDLTSREAEEWQILATHTHNSLMRHLLPKQGQGLERAAVFVIFGVRKELQMHIFILQCWQLFQTQLSGTVCHVGWDCFDVFTGEVKVVLQGQCNFRLFFIPALVAGDCLLPSRFVVMKFSLNRVATPLSFQQWAWCPSQSLAATSAVNHLLWKCTVWRPEICMCQAGGGEQMQLAHFWGLNGGMLFFNYRFHV